MPTPEELNKLLSIVNEQWNRGIKHSIEWQQAFDFYNANNERQLRLGCFSCYIKVMIFIKQSIALYA